MPDGKNVADQNLNNSLDNQASAPSLPSKKSPLLIILILLLLLIFGLLSFLTYFLVTGKLGSLNKTTEILPKEETAPESGLTPIERVVTPSAKETTIYYQESCGIYSRQLNGTLVKVLWDICENMPEGGMPAVSINYLQKIDEKTLGVGGCETKLGDFGCALYTLDVETGSRSLLESLDETELLGPVGFFDKDTAAFIAMNEPIWLLRYIDGDTFKTLDTLSGEAYGRGGFEEDSSKIKFSPDGKKVFHIDTSSPRAPIGFDVYVYDLTTGGKTIINNATQPDWVSNSKIVFRQYAQGGGVDTGLYFYDLVSGTREKIQGQTDPVSSSSYRPLVSPNKELVLFEDWEARQIRTYSPLGDRNKLQLEGASSGRWISDTLIAFEKITTCDQETSPNCGPVGYTVNYVGVYDISKNSEVLQLNDLKGTWGLAR